MSDVGMIKKTGRRTADSQIPSSPSEREFQNQFLDGHHTRATERCNCKLLQILIRITYKQEDLSCFTVEEVCGNFLARIT